MVSHRPAKAPSVKAVQVRLLSSPPVLGVKFSSTVERQKMGQWTIFIIATMDRAIIGTRMSSTLIT